MNAGSRPLVRRVENGTAQCGSCLGRLIALRRATLRRGWTRCAALSGLNHAGFQNCVGEPAANLCPIRFMRGFSGL